MNKGAALLGVDVGFSAKNRSTGVAWRVDGVIGACLTGTPWPERRAALPEGVIFDAAALDAPLVPASAEVTRRGCESAFYRGAFSGRCKPGMSHFGRGLELRKAGAAAAVQFASVLRPGELPGGVAPGVPMVEAFPNTFMGVLLPEALFDGPGRFVKARGSRFRSDWLYEVAVSSGAFHRLLEDLGWDDAATSGRLAQETDHDLRAAFVCLLTAGFAFAGTATVVGDALGGWFCLPPSRLWAPWAVAALDETTVSARRRGYPHVAIGHHSEV